MDLRLKDKVVLISGGSKGIGLYTALAFAGEGCHVGLCGRNDQDLQWAQEKLRRQGVSAVAIQADVCDPQDAARFVHDCAAQLGGVDVLVNNVGGSTGGSNILTATDAEWRQTFELNLFQAVRLTRLASPYMRQRGGGAVVNIASISGWSPQLASSAQYGGTKAAMIFLTERLALELVDSNIRVNTVSPGSIMKTRFWDSFRQEHPDSFNRLLQEGFPMRRLGTPGEVADVVVFVASPRASWINGRHIPVDGLQQPVGIRENRPW